MPSRRGRKPIPKMQNSSPQQGAKIQFPSSPNSRAVGLNARYYTDLYSSSFEGWSSVVEGTEEK